MRLRGGPWEASIRPRRGGRITSLKLRGEELLDQGIAVDDPKARGFVEGGAFGWDEMVPNLEATDSLPDHGEAWRVPWEVVDHNDSSVVMSCRGTLVPWLLERRILLAEGVDALYRYTNVGHQAHAAYWCAHPLFKYEPGMRVSAPLPNVPALGTSTKIFLPSRSIEHVTLGWGSGSGIDIRWDPALTPEVAIWMCNGDLGGYHQIAVEPATAAPVLQPGASFEWWLRITAL